MKILLLALLASCTELPRGQLPDRSVRDRAVELAERTFGRHRLASPFVLAQIVWVNASTLVVDGRGDREAREAAYVITYERDLPHCCLIVPVGERISDSSFLHGALHCTLAIQYGDPDGDHRRAEWYLLADMKAALASEGL